MKIVCDWQHCGHSTALFSHGATALGGGCWRVCAVAQLWQMTLVKEVGSKITPKQPSSPSILLVLYFFKHKPECSRIFILPCVVVGAVYFLHFLNYLYSILYDH